MSVSRFAVSFLVAVIACGGDDDGEGDGRVDGGAGDGGSGDDGGGSLTCADFEYAASGVSCAATCEPVFCPCPGGLSTSVSDCTPDGCLVAGSCEAM